MDTAVTKDATTPGWFNTTCWNILRGGSEENASDRELALDYVCTAYWQPVYQFISNRGHLEEEAKDLTQEFFSRLVRDRAYEKADSVKGKFRSYLLLLLKHFLADEARKRTAQKRGGACIFVPLDEASTVPAKDGDPFPSEFDKRWALNLLERTSRKLAAEYQDRGLDPSVLKEFEPGAESSINYAQAAAALGLTENAVKTVIYRFRRRHGELLRQEVQQTLADPDTLQEEIRYLLTILRS